MTPASDVKPVRRIVAGPDGQPFVAEIFKRGIVLRPVRSPRGGSREFRRSWSQIYVDAAGGAGLRARSKARR